MVAEAVVGAPTGAGTVICISSTPFTQGPVTVQRRIYVPCIRLVTVDVLLVGVVITGTFGPLTTLHVPFCPPVPFPAYEAANVTDVVVL